MEPELPVTSVNEPAGMSILYRNIGDVSTLSAQGWQTVVSGGSDFDDGIMVEPAGDNPIGTQSVLRVQHYGPDAPVKGGGRARVTRWSNLTTTDSGPVEEIYIRMWIFFEGAVPHQQKLFYIGPEPDAHARSQIKTNDMHFSIWPGGLLKMTLQGLSQGNQSTWLALPDLSPVFGETGHAGRWNVFEIRVLASSAPGAPDGEIDIWVNGQLLREKDFYGYNTPWDGEGSIRGWTLNDVNGTGRLFDGFEWHAASQSANDVESDHAYRFGEYYISGRN